MFRPINSASERWLLQTIFEFMTRLRALDAVNLLRVYRQNAEAVRDQELKKALLSLAKGAQPEDVLLQLARTLTNKLMHHPSVQLKNAAAKGQHKQLEWAQKLLGLNPGQAWDSANSQQSSDYEH